MVGFNVLFVGFWIDMVDMVEFDVLFVELDDVFVFEETGGFEGGFGAEVAE